MELTFWEAFGVFGSLSSIMSLFIAAPGWKSKAVHMIYALFISGMVIWFMDYQTQVKESLSELERIKRIEQQAQFLVGDVDLSTAGNMQGYMQAGLAFLEKNKELFSETYERAKKLCENCGCTDSGYKKGNDSLNYFNRMQQASSAMRMLIRAISTLGVE